jgi:hypothetical protein
MRSSLTTERAAGIYKPRPHPAGLFFGPGMRSTPAMARIRYPTRREAEQRFHDCVDIPVSSLGGRRQLYEMLSWCREHVETGAWTKHGRSQRWAGEPPQSFVRFYFGHEADAEAFKKRWLP